MRTGGCRIVVDVAPPGLSEAARQGMSDQPIVPFRLVVPDGVFEAAGLIVANAPVETSRLGLDTTERVHSGGRTIWLNRTHQRLGSD
jgi:hypothetical protein